MKLTSLFLFGLSVILLGSCTNKSDSEIEVFQGQIISISCPTQVITGTDVEVKVQFAGENGCSDAYNITADKVGQLVQLKAFYSQPKTPQNCTEILPYFTLSYTFFADLQGSYFFQDANNPTIGDTLIVY